jgi:hypothetical protein
MEAASLENIGFGNSMKLSKKIVMVTFDYHYEFCVQYFMRTDHKMRTGKSSFYFILEFRWWDD